MDDVQQRVPSPLSDSSPKSPQHKEWPSLSEEEISEFRDYFTLYDNDASGCIRASDLGKAIWSVSYEVTETQAAEIVGSRETIDFPEFLTVMVKEKEDIREAFEVFDRNGDGFVSAAEVHHVMTTLGEKLTHEEVDEMIRIADQDGDGRVSYEEFVNIFTSK